MTSGGSGGSLPWTLGFWVLPLVCIVGFFLNIVSAAVFAALGSSARTKREVNGLRLYLIALSLFDAVQLLLSIFVIVLPNMETSLDPREDEGLARKLHIVGAYSLLYLYPIMMAANYASIWTITAITGARYLAICHPLSSLHKYPALRRRRIIIGAITLLALVTNLPRFFEFRLLPGNGSGNGSESLPQLQLTPLRRSTAYVVLNDGIAYPLLLYIFPLLLLASLNSSIFATIRRQPRLTRPRLSNVSVMSWHDGGWAHEGRNRILSPWESRSALMIATIVLLFFMCNTLAVILRWIGYRWELMDPSVSTIHNGNSTYLLITGISNFLINFNSAANPFIYFYFTRMFRDFAKEMKRGSRTDGPAQAALLDDH